MADVLLTSSGTASIASFSRDGYPSVDVTEDSGTLSAVVSGIDGIAPTRELTTEEQAAGVTSLDPPTVETVDGPEELRELAQRALSASVASSRGGLTGAEDVILRWRVAVAVNAALRELGYEV